MRQVDGPGPLSDFEQSEGYTLGSLNGQFGWVVGPGTAIVANLDIAHGGNPSS